MNTDYTFIKDLRTAMKLVAITIIVAAVVLIIVAVSGWINETLRPIKALHLIVNTIIFSSVGSLMLLAGSEVLGLLARKSQKLNE